MSKLQHILCLCRSVSEKEAVDLEWARAMGKGPKQQDVWESMKSPEIERCENLSTSPFPLPSAVIRQPRHSFSGGAVAVKVPTMHSAGYGLLSRPEIVVDITLSSEIRSQAGQSASIYECVCFPSERQSLTDVTESHRRDRVSPT